MYTKTEFDLLYYIPYDVSWRAHFSVQPNLYVTYELDKAPLLQPLVFKSLTRFVRVLGQEQQVIKANSPCMAG